MSIEDDPDFSAYWTAIPEAMRWVVGDPIGDPISVDKFRDTVERHMAVIESDVEWDDESHLSDVVGIVHTDGAESTAAGLAIDMNAAAIYEHNDGLYIVCGSNFNSQTASGSFFPWALVVVGDDEDGDGGDGDYHSDPDNRTDYSVSGDAARWTPRMASGDSASE